MTTAVPLPFRYRPEGWEARAIKSFGKIQRLQKHGKPSRFYYVREYDSDTQRDRWTSTKCTTRKAAQEWVRTREMELALGTDRKQARSAVSFPDGLLVWLEAKRSTVSRKQAQALESMTNFWQAYFGSKLIREITTSDLRRYLTHRAAGTVPGRRTLRPLSVATVNNDIVAIRDFFTFAVNEGWIDRSPASGVKRRPGAIKNRVRSLTPQEEQALLEACRRAEPVTVTAKRNGGGRAGGKNARAKSTFKQPRRVPDYLYPLTFVALRCGFRRRTLLSIRWCDVDLKKRRWQIPGEYMKTRETYQAPVPKSVVAELNRYRSWLAESIGAESSYRLDHEERIFGLSPDSDIGRSFQSAVRRAGLDGLTFHDLRRCYLNRLRERGVPIDTAMRLTTHRSFQTVLKFYREVPEADLLRAVDAIDDPEPDGGDQ